MKAVLLALLASLRAGLRSRTALPLDVLAPRHQHLQAIATALYTAMRKGEVGGLLKTDVDLDAGVIRLQRCWDGPATKDGKPLLVPIVKSLGPYLEGAMAASGSLHVFPAPDGGMHRRT
jgi:integrase